MIASKIRKKKLHIINATSISTRSLNIETYLNVKGYMKSTTVVALELNNEDHVIPLVAGP